MNELKEKWLHLLKMHRKEDHIGMMRLQLYNENQKYFIPSGTIVQDPETTIIACESCICEQETHLHKWSIEIHLRVSKINDCILFVHHNFQTCHELSLYVQDIREKKNSEETCRVYHDDECIATCRIDQFSLPVLQERFATKFDKWITLWKEDQKELLLYKQYLDMNFKTTYPSELASFFAPFLPPLDDSFFVSSSSSVSSSSPLSSFPFVSFPSYSELNSFFTSFLPRDDSSDSSSSDSSSDSSSSSV